MKKVLLILCLVSLLSEMNAQHRADNPFQVQVNLSGVFLRAAGNTLADKEVLDLEVKDWEMPGLTLGYHLSNKLYVGYAFHPNRNLILTEQYAFNQEGVNDILINVDHETGTFHTLNARFFPWSPGVYGSFFFTHVSEATYELEGVALGDSWDVVSQSYEDVLSAQWNFKDLSTFGVGLGYNHVSEGGFSFDIGLGIPISFAESLHENIKIINEDQEFNADDILHIKEVIEDEQFYFPAQFYFSIGKNF